MVAGVSNASAWEVESRAWREVGEFRVIFSCVVSLKSVMRLSPAPPPQNVSTMLAMTLVNGRLRGDALVMPLFVFPYPALCRV